jgi:copper chaperone
MTESVILNVSGMKCGGCETNVQNKLSTVAGVKVAKASSKDKTVQVEYEAGQTNLDAIKAAIQAAGYSVQP